MERYELMEQSILKNLQELSELCVDNGIYNAYDLMDLLENYMELLEKVKKNGKVVVKI